MSIENQTETAQLTSDLTGARDQVIALQDRLSRMEMLFLQQATGVASEKLSSNVLRSLSGINNSLSHQLANELTDEHSALYEPKEGSKNEGTAAINDEDIVRQNIIEDAIQAHVSSGDAMSPDEVVRVLRLTRESGEGMSARLLSHGPEDVKAVAMSIQLQEALRISNEIFEEKFDLSHSGSKQSLNSKVSEVDLSRMLTPRGAQSAVNIGKAERELYAAVPSAAWLPLLLDHVSELLAVLSPTVEALASRHKVFEYVRSIVSSTLGVQLFPTGSFVSHTFLPDGDVDATAFVLKSDDDSWFVRVNEALCMSAFNQFGGGAHSSKHSSFDTNPETAELLERCAASNPPVTISNVSFVNAEIKMIKSMIDSVSVDISVNQISALYSQSFIEKIDAFVAKDHLFKRSILLTKAWCQYESPRHTHGSGSLAGVRDGRISSWAMVVMLAWVFNSEGRDIHHPLQALGHFLRIYSSFDWDSFALTINGPVSASDLSEVPAHHRKKAEDLFFPAEVTEAFLLRSEDTRKMSCFPSSASSSHSSSAVTPSSAPSDDSVSLASVSLDTASVVPSVSTKAHAANTWATRSAFPEIDCVYQQGLLNVMDPVAPTGCCCLTRSLDAQGFEAITSALREGYKHFQSMCEAFSALPAKLSPSTSPESVHNEVSKASKVFLLNTSSRVTALTQSISRNLARVSGTSTATSEDVLRAQTDELDFSLSYAELVLGGRVSQSVLVQLILQILIQKGQMPVGEIGKNLQAITGCDTLSKRLKEQFSGLKKAIEMSGCARLKVGSEHPFNPIVTLVDVAPEDQVSPAVFSSLPPFAHASFVFTPILAMAALTSSNMKESSSLLSKSLLAGAKGTYRRQPPYYLTGGQQNNFDTMSVISQSTRGGSSGVDAHHGVPMMYATTVDGSAGGYVPVVMAPGGGAQINSPQAMSMYQQQQQMHMAYLQQQQMYANYAAASMAASSGSLGSSYGHSMSPGNLSKPSNANRLRTEETLRRCPPTNSLDAQQCGRGRGRFVQRGKAGPAGLRVCLRDTMSMIDSTPHPALPLAHSGVPHATFSVIVT
eukprot:gene23918-30197_t